MGIRTEPEVVPTLIRNLNLTVVQARTVLRDLMVDMTVTIPTYSIALFIRSLLN